MNRSEKIEQVSASLFAVHRTLAEAGLPKKDAKGQARGNKEYRYLSLPALIEHLHLKLKEAQLFVTQEVAGGQGFVEVNTTVWHFSGQYIEFGPAFMPTAGAAQDVGSAITYCRRYALAAVFNLAADEDDDAAKASKTSGRAATAMSTAPPDGADGNGEGVAAPGGAGGGTAPGGADPIPALAYLTREQIEDYANALGGKTKMLKAARLKYPDKVFSLRDLTQAQADALLVQGG